MLKFIAPLLVVISPCVAAGPAQAPTAPEYTDDLINGRYWSGMSEPEKLRWLHGYTDGLRVAAALVEGEPCITQVNRVFNLYPRQLSFGEIMKGTVHFYQDTPENAPVPVTAAVRYVTLKASGAPQSELDAFVADRRKPSAAPVKKP